MKVERHESRIMAGDTPRNPAKALECKERGNRCFQAGDWAGAEKLYSEAYVSFLLVLYPKIAKPERN